MIPIYKPFLNKVYTDNDIYQMFNLTQNEINFVESNVK
jgi:hypothetical protein